jgi:hypothetical protein
MVKSVEIFSDSNEENDYISSEEKKPIKSKKTKAKAKSVKKPIKKSREEAKPVKKSSLQEQALLRHAKTIPEKPKKTQTNKLRESKVRPKTIEIESYNEEPRPYNGEDDYLLDDYETVEIRPVNIPNQNSLPQSRAPLTRDAEKVTLKKEQKQLPPEEDLIVKLNDKIIEASKVPSPEKPKKSKHKKEKNEKEDVEETAERYELVDKYKKYRSAFQFKREEINPNKANIEKLRYEIDQLQNELNSQGTLSCAYVALFVTFNVIETVSKMIPIGLKLDGLSQTAMANKQEFDSVLKELMIKYDVFSSSCETRFVMLVIKTVIACHATNKKLEEIEKKNANIDPNKIQILEDKYKNI